MRAGVGGISLLAALNACAPNSPVEPSPSKADAGDAWTLLEPAGACEIRRLPKPIPGWLTWSQCSDAPTCDVADLDASTVPVFADDVRLARNGTPWIVIRSNHRLYVADESGTLVDGFSFSGCNVDEFDARSDRLAVLFAPPMYTASDPYLMLSTIIASPEAPYLHEVWAPDGGFGKSALGLERWLFMTQGDTNWAGRLRSMAVTDANDLLELEEAYFYGLADADDAFVYLREGQSGLDVYRTSGTSGGEPILSANAQVCFADRSQSYLIWADCDFGTIANSKIWRADWQNPTQAGSTLLVQGAYTSGIVSDGWFVSGTDAQSAIAVRIENSELHDLGVNLGYVIGVTPWHAYGALRDVPSGRTQLKRITMP